jgi:hypothetical protein
VLRGGQAGQQVGLERFAMGCPDGPPHHHNVNGPVVYCHVLEAQPILQPN